MPVSYSAAEKARIMARAAELLSLQGTHVQGECRNPNGAGCMGTLIGDAAEELFPGRNSKPGSGYLTGYSLGSAIGHDLAEFRTSWLPGHESICTYNDTHQANECVEALQSYSERLAQKGF